MHRMSSSAASVLELPATPDQVRRAREIVERVCAELGIVGDISVERYQDPGSGEPPVALFTVTIREEVPHETFSALIVTLPRRMRPEGLYIPVAPIQTYVSPEW
jgi:hypothetical protein